MRVCIIRNVFDRTYFKLWKKLRIFFLVTYSDSQLFAPNGLIEWPFRSTVKFLGPPTKDLDDRVYDPAVKRIIFHWFAGWIKRRGRGVLERGNFVNSQYLRMTLRCPWGYFGGLYVL